MTIDDYSPLFALFVLFVIRYSPLFAVRYSRLFAVRCSLFATIRYSLFGFSRHPAQSVCTSLVFIRLCGHASFSEKPARSFRVQCRAIVANLIDLESEFGKSRDTWLKERAFFRWHFLDRELRTQKDLVGTKRCLTRLNITRKVRRL